MKCLRRRKRKRAKRKAVKHLKKVGKMLESKEWEETARELDRVYGRKDDNQPDH